MRRETDVHMSMSHSYSNFPEKVRINIRHRHSGISGVKTELTQIVNICMVCTDHSSDPYVHICTYFQNIGHNWQFDHASSSSRFIPLATSLSRTESGGIQKMPTKW